MKAFAKPAIVLGLAGAMAFGVTAAQARGFHHHGGFVAGAAGFAAGAAIGAAAASNSYYYGPGAYSAYDPAYAYTGDPAYEGYGYDAYAYAPGYRGSGYSYDASTQSAPAHYDPSYGYNSNTLSPWQDRKLQGTDY